MSDVAALPGSIEPATKKGTDLNGGTNPLRGIIYLGVVAAALLFVAYSIYAGTRVTSYLPYLLFIALLIALGFGFHDTANAVATAIYRHSLPHAASVFSTSLIQYDVPNTIASSLKL